MKALGFCAMKESLDVIGGVFGSIFVCSYSKSIVLPIYFEFGLSFPSDLVQRCGGSCVGLALVMLMMKTVPTS